MVEAAAVPGGDRWTGGALRVEVEVGARYFLMAVEVARLSVMEGEELVGKMMEAMGEGFVN